MIELTEKEKNCKDKKELVYMWLYNKEISYKDITEMYVETIENEKQCLQETLSESDVYVSTLIDGNKKDIEYQRPYAIEYMLENERLKGTKWYDDLLKGGSNE